MDNKKIIVVGGTGFVGQGILSVLNNKDFELHSLSRHQFIPTDTTDQVTYHAADLNKPGEWQDLLREADWVVDAVGILLPNLLNILITKTVAFSPRKDSWMFLRQRTKLSFCLYPPMRHLSF